MRKEKQNKITKVEILMESSERLEEDSDNWALGNEGISHPNGNI